jgi:hypothetical protein
VVVVFAVDFLTTTGDKGVVVSKVKDDTGVTTTTTSGLLRSRTSKGT